MSKGLLFWIILILWLIFGLLFWWPAAAVGGGTGYAPLGIPVIVFVLFFLLGWKVFGPPIQG